MNGLIFYLGCLRDCLTRGFFFIRTLVRQRPTAIKESIDSTPSDSYLHSENKGSSAVVWLKPRDKKLPLVAIPVDQAPEGFLQYHEEYQKRLFVVSAEIILEICP
jgi:Dis3-like cold-shock domain 2 (CSD2)